MYYAFLSNDLAFTIPCEQAMIIKDLKTGEVSVRECCLPENCEPLGNVTNLQVIKDPQDCIGWLGIGPDSDGNNQG